MICTTDIHLNVDSIHEKTIAKFDANIIRFDPTKCHNLWIINGLMAAPNATVDNKRMFSCSVNWNFEENKLVGVHVESIWSSVFVRNNHHYYFFFVLVFQLHVPNSKFPWIVIILYANGTWYAQAHERAVVRILQLLFDLLANGIFDTLPHGSRIIGDNKHHFSLAFV